MKKTTLSIIAAGLATASAAYAAVPTGSAPFQVTVPNLKAGPSFTLEGLFLRPTSSDLGYANTTDSNSNSQSHVLTPGYGLGFGVGVGYVFPESGNDVQINWQHFNHSTTTDPVGTDSLTSVSSDGTFKFDTIDLDVGQYLDIGTRFQTRLFAGLRYAALKQDVSNTTSSAASALSDASSSVVDNVSKFTGIGPRLGVDATYHINNSFGVVSHLATGLLIGNVDNDSTTTATPATFNGNSTNTADTQTRVVPEIDAKLGFDYTVPFKDQASSMTVEAGYQVTQYIDAIDSKNSTGGIGFNGPYLNLNFKM